MFDIYVDRYDTGRTLWGSERTWAKAQEQVDELNAELGADGFAEVEEDRETLGTGSAYGELPR